jgi:hypothetical protein
MSFKKIAAIVLTATASVAFAGVAQAQVTDNYTGSVPGYCSITSAPITLLTPNVTNAPATILSGTGTNAITCNSGSAFVTVAPGAVAGLSNPSSAISTTSIAFSAGAGAYSGASGLTKTSNGSPSTIDSVTVRVAVTASANNLLVASTVANGGYVIPVDVTITP